MKAEFCPLTKCTIHWQIVRHTNAKCMLLLYSTKTSTHYPCNIINLQLPFARQRQWTPHWKQRPSVWRSMTIWSASHERRELNTGASSVMNKDHAKKPREQAHEISLISGSSIMKKNSLLSIKHAKRMIACLVLEHKNMAESNFPETRQSLHETNTCKSVIWTKLFKCFDLTFLRVCVLRMCQVPFP